MSRSVVDGLRDVVCFTGSIRAGSQQTIEECVAVLRDRPRSSTWFGGFNTRLSVTPSKKTPNEVYFVLEYYRQRRTSARSGYLVQLAQGVFYRENGQTRLLAKVRFKSGAVLGLWLALLLTLAAFGLLAYTGNIVMWVLIGLTISFLLAMVAILLLDRTRLVRMVRQSLKAA